MGIVTDIDLVYVLMWTLLELFLVSDYKESHGVLDYLSEGNGLPDGIFAANLRKKQKRLRTKRRLILNMLFLQKSDVFMCEKDQFFEEIFCVPTFCLVFSSFVWTHKKMIANYTVNSCHFAQLKSE